MILLAFVIPVACPKAVDPPNATARTTRLAPVLFIPWIMVTSPQGVDLAITSPVASRRGARELACNFNAGEGTEPASIGIGFALVGEGSCPRGSDRSRTGSECPDRSMAYRAP